MSYSSIVVKNSRLASLRRRHPWIFSRAIISHSHLEDGELVNVLDQQGNFMATGYYQDGSIMVRVLTWSRQLIDHSFWVDKLRAAKALRQKLGLPDPTTNAFRLVHGEGDGVPGLIIDVYDRVAVLQCHTIGVHRLLSDIDKALREVMSDTIDYVYDKSVASLPIDYSATVGDRWLADETSNVIIKENDHQFHIDVVNGQKTGFFLDQRDNRELLARFCTNRSVLNLYCYTGGFSIYALNHQASFVTSIDASRKAIEILETNVALAENSNKHEAHVADVNRYLKTVEKDQYDIIIVDPPAFAKSIRKKHNAVQAYKRINKLAIEKVKSGGMVFTFSCSQVIDHQLFYNTITASAIEAGRKTRVLFQMSQGADHPVSIFHHEGKYLKGLALAID